jgi:hypothetical protein
MARNGPEAPRGERGGQDEGRPRGRRGPPPGTGRGRALGRGRLIAAPLGSTVSRTWEQLAEV